MRLYNVNCIVFYGQNRAYIMVQSSYCKQCHTSIFQDEVDADKPKRIGLLRASLDLPPSVNHLYQNRKGGGKFLSETARTWRDGAALILQSTDTWKDIEAIARARSSHMMLAFHIQAFLPQSKIRSRDIDNMAKLCQDTVTRVVGIDDSQVFDVYLSKRPLKQSKQTAYMLVALEALEAV